MQESWTETRLGRGVDMLAGLSLEFESPEKLSNADKGVTFCKVNTWPNISVESWWRTTKSAVSRPVNSKCVAGSISWLSQWLTGNAHQLLEFEARCPK